MVKRYDHELDPYHDGGCYGVMEQEGGEYVTYEDYQALESKLPRWRITAHELPQKQGRVLAYWPSMETTLGGPIDCIYYSEKARHPWGVAPREPLCWMPLPELPELLVERQK